MKRDQSRILRFPTVAFSPTSPEPKASFPMAEIPAEVLLSVIDRSRDLSREMEHVRTIGPSRQEGILSLIFEVQVISINP